MIYDVTVLTDSRYLNDSNDEYKHNVYYEDKLVVDSLRALGLTVIRKAWDDVNFDWATSKVLLFRTTWDYFDRFDEFSKWLSKISQQSILVNSELLIRWNIDKHYLQDLKDKGIHIPPTEFIASKTKITLKELHTNLGWNETVLKPCIAGAARHTYRLSAENLFKYEQLFEKLIQEEAMMLQPFQHNIVSRGEISMMLFNGQFTHAILKKAKAGDFRVQDDFGGSVQDYNPTEEEIYFAQRALSGCPELPIYARVDIFYDNNNELVLGELELIEPELWFRNYPNAANFLANAINAILHP